MLGRFKYIAFAFALATVLAIATDSQPAAAQDCDRCGGGRTGGGFVSENGVGARVGGDGNIVPTSSGASSNCVFWAVEVGDFFGAVDVGPEDGPSGNNYIQLDDGRVVSWIAWQCFDPGVSASDCVRISTQNRGGGLITDEDFDFFDTRFARSFDCPSGVDDEGNPIFDGIPDGQLGDQIVELGDPNLLAIFALDNVPWPGLEILTYPEDERSIVSGFEVPLLLDDGAGTDFTTTFAADASDNGLVVTATGTARVVEWDQSAINAQFGFGSEQFFECDTFGEAFIPTSIAPNPCVARWRGSSSGQTDNIGTPNRISLEAVVVYDITYETNLPGVDVTFGDVEFELVIERNAVPVNEVQVLHIDR